MERDTFSNATSILPKWIDVDNVNINKLRMLNRPVVKICAVHKLGETKAKKADLDEAKGLEAEILLAKGARVMLSANL